VGLGLGCKLLLLLFSLHPIGPLRYDPGIPSVMPMVGGCLKEKNTKRCVAVLRRCLAVFLSFVTFFTICNFCKLLFIVERGKVCYFFYCL